ncbi:cupin domain-containing protein [Acinetobacter sp. WZC-1]|uniref:cupin domain-containing protein n=1 Tax=Acinetobacter sp. WZC-1 TaxID=3459034 RepID=UPI00403DD32D
MTNSSQQLLRTQPESTSHIETPTDPSASVQVISRTDIRAITEVEVDGQIHQLGEHRDFRRNSALAAFIPENGRYSFSWVRLKNGEILDNHQHSTKSLIIVTQGSVYLTGSQQKLLQEGDAVCVPPGQLHGFRSEEGQTFHGLSIQFEGEGLYENEITPRVEFLAGEKQVSYQDLDHLNNQLGLRHEKNALFRLFESGQLQTRPAMKQRFLEALYVWSVYFQKMLYARQAFCTNDELYAIYSEHLHDEFGHDEILRVQNNLTNKIYDPALEAASLWFINKMMSSDEAEKIVIVHMVVETSGDSFGKATENILTHDHNESDPSYFEIHAEADEGHNALGRPYLQKLSASQFPKLMETCRQAWDQMDIIHERIAALTLQAIH